MKHKNSLIKAMLCCISFLTCSMFYAQEWQMKQATLMTEWSNQIDPENVWPEYPRPQMVRADWMNLNGVWDLGKNKAKYYIINTGQEVDNSIWKYITGGEGFTVSGNWNSDLNYDESGWKEGAAGFGDGSSRTQWTNETIYLRKKVTFPTLSADDIAKLKLEIFHDEDFQLYINGVLAASATGYIGGYQEFEISAEAKAAIKQGQENLIAIKCIQTTGGQYIDAGMFVDSEPLPYGEYYSDQAYDQKILVPFPIESAISGIMDTDYGDVTKWYSYRREFTIPDNMKGKEILLHFGAVDWRCFVFVNGEKVGNHDGGFDPFSFNITSKLKANGANELVVQVYDPSSHGGQPGGKQHTSPGSIFYTPATGIWQTVWLESVNPTYIKDFRITPDVDKKKAIFNVRAENAEGASVKITILDNGTEVASTTAAINTDVELAIAEPKLWDTENPFLYDVKFELSNSSGIVDEVTSYFGMRKISIAKIKGTPWMVLNDKPVFQFGVLDQGYWPDGIFTAPCEEALVYDIIKTKELGFNMMRKHIKTEPARWYYACDKMGMLVWQDIPNGWENGAIGREDGGDGDEVRQEIFKNEMVAVMNSLINYPSIIVWTIFNEAWGQYNWNTNHVDASLALAREIDDTRVMNATSGWTDIGAGDLFDRHSYPDVSLFWDGERPSLCGESGGLSLVVDGHTWDGNQFVYEPVESPEALKNRFIDYVNRAKTLQMSGLTGVVYTQITDVEAECNGLITYDRLMKNTPDQIAAIKEALDNIIQNIYVPIIKPVNEVRETGEWDKPGERPYEEWKYVMGAPSGEWTTLDYNDAAWNTGKSGFGPANGEWSSVRQVVGTDWDCYECDIYLRKTITLNLTEEEISKLKLHLWYDDNVEVYFNGVLAFEGEGYLEEYMTKEISQAAKDALNPEGENVIAVHCYQDWWGQYIDLGLYYETHVSDLSIDPIPVFILEDKVPFSNPATVRSANVTFTRNGLEADEYSTIYLPFATTLEDIEVYAFKNSTDNTIVFSKVDQLKANTPYLIKPTVNMDLVIEEKNVTVEATTKESTAGDNAYKFLGSYDNITATSGMYGISPTTNSFVQAGENVTISAFRAYLQAVDPSGAAHSLAIRIDDATTITDIAANTFTIYTSGNALYIATESPLTVNIYAIDGRLVRAERIEEGLTIINGLQQGIYIVNGQKVVIR